MWSLCSETIKIRLKTWLKKSCTVICMHCKTIHRVCKDWVCYRVRYWRDPTYIYINNKISANSFKCERRNTLIGTFYFLHPNVYHVTNMLSNYGFLVCFKYKWHIIYFLLTSPAWSVYDCTVKFQTSVFCTNLHYWILRSAYE